MNWQETIEEILVPYRKEIRCSWWLETSEGRSFGENADDLVRAASLIKLPLYESMVRAVQANQWQPATSIRLEPTDRVGGSGYVQLLAKKECWSVAELMTAMIAGSDNQATNTLLRLLGLETVQEIYATDPGILIQRPMMAAATAGDNCISARAAVACLRRIEQLGNRTGTNQELMAPFKQQQFQEGLPGLLIEQDIPGLAIFNKTGRLDRLEHDVAAFQYAGKMVWMAVLTEDLTGNGRGIELLRQFGKAVFQLLKA